MFRFYKYQGAGNDFILIDGMQMHPQFSKDEISNLCSRHYGIGADGLIILTPCNQADFEMLYYNADGGLGSMCGNGGRCAVAFAQQIRLVKNTCTFKAYDGMHHAFVLETNLKESTVKLQMADVDLIMHTALGYVLNTGSPHVVVFVADVADVDVVKQGAALRYNDAFLPGGTNVNFVSVHDDVLHVRTYERGVENETQSCGTGVTACALAYAFKTNTNIQNVRLKTPGGLLEVNFKLDATHASQIYLTGLATQVFSGEIVL
ncbi:MAG: diaminopimelate epimerase [Bacteroidia bacterium]|nr:diaminopimelate epimerase [Bacteroidia bacterium]